MDQKPDSAREVRQMLMTLRIIVFSLVMGVSVFVGFAITVGSRDDPPAAREPSMLWLYMAIFAGGALLARMAVPGVIYRNIRRQIASGSWQPSVNRSAPANAMTIETDEGLLMGALQAKTIIACALLEGAAFANAYAYFATQHVVSLAITLVLILMIALHFPLRLWLDEWITEQTRWLEEERSLRAQEPN